MIETDDIYLGYGHLEVIKGISFKVDIGEVVCILGGNGSGKSTILKSISGFLRASKGDVLLEDQSINKLEAYQRFHLGIAYIPQDRKLFNNKTVFQNLELGCLCLPLNRNEIKTRIDKMFDFFPILEHKRNDKALTMSGGEQQTLALARALVSNPRILLLDEPSAGLAPVWVDRLHDILISVIKEFSLTVIVVEQNIYAGLEISDRGIVIQNGLVALEQPSAELKKSEDLIKSYLGG